MTIYDRLYWFKHNLIRLPFILIWLPFEWCICILKLCKIMMTTNGSETLDFPWER